MFHFFGAITNKNGDALPGYFVRAVDPGTGDVAPIYSDASGTPIVNASGIADMALVDSDGNVSFYINPGEYDVDIYAADANTLYKRVSNLPLGLNTITLASGSAVSTIGGMQAIASPVVGQLAELTLAGSEGSFVFSTADLSAEVAADSAQMNYVAPASDTTGASGAWVRTLDATLVGDGGSSLVGFLPSGTGAVARTVASKLGDTISVKDFGATGDGITDDTAAIQAAATAAAGKSLYFPGGTYLISDAITVPSNVRVFGDGDASLVKSTSLVDFGVNGGQRQFDVRDVSGILIENLAFDNSALTVFGSGTRNIYCTGSSDFTIRNCKFTTCGAAVASVNCHDYRIENNRITLSATDGEAHNDGALDQWWGSHGFVIQNNWIDASGVAGGVSTAYAILVTGEQTDGTAAACYDFLISGNSILSAKNTAIWSSGRSGINYDFQIVNNRIDTVTDFHGIMVTDSKRFAVSGNTLRNIAFNAIRLGEEAGEGTYSCTDAVVAHNTVEDTNMGLSASDLSGSAIGIADSSARISVGPNTVKGANHRWAVFFQSTTSGCELVGGGAMQKGTQGTVLNGSSSNRTPGYNSYTPALTAVANVAASAATVCRFEREGDVVRVSGRVDITPTAAASTSTSLNIALPVASDLAAGTDLNGVANTQFGVLAGISGDAANNAALIKFPATNTGNNSFFFSFEYVVK